MLSQVKVIITDGCPQELIQIDNISKIIFKNTLHIQCGLNLVRMGWAVRIIKKYWCPDEFGSLCDNVCNHMKR